MRACHLVYGYFPFDPRVRREVETLRKLGHAVDVVALQEAGEPREESVLGVRVHRIPLRAVRGGRARYLYQYALFFLLASVLLFRLHRRHRFDIVHVHSLPDFQIFGAWPERVTGARLVLDLHEAMPEILAARFRLGRKSVLLGLARALEAMSCMVAHSVVVVNTAIRTRLAGRGIDPAKMIVVMNSPAASQLVGRGVDDHREHFGIVRGKTIVYVGGINPERDLTLLVRAVARLRGSHDLRLAIFGYGDEAYRKRLQDTARAEGFEDRFVLGPRLPHEDVFSYIAMSEIGPITFERNPLTELAVPNKVFEYAAARKPLVIADLPALHSTFGDAAVYYAPGDADDLSRKLVHVLSHPELGRQLSERAWAVLGRCSWEIMSQRLANLYANSSGPQGA